MFSHLQDEFQKQEKKKIKEESVKKLLMIFLQTGEMTPKTKQTNDTQEAVGIVKYL